MGWGMLVLLLEAVGAAPLVWRFLTTGTITPMTRLWILPGAAAAAALCFAAPRFLMSRGTVIRDDGRLSCLQCRYPLQPDWRRCPECGGDLGAPDVVVRGTLRPSKGATIACYGMGACVIVLSVLFVIFFPS